MIKVLYTSFFLFFCTSLIAQDTATKKPFYLVVKTAPLNYLLGEYPLYVEYAIHPQLSLEGKVGLNYSASAYQRFGLGNKDRMPYQRFPKLGYSLGASARFYPNSRRRLRGIFWEANANFMQYRSLIDNICSTGQKVTAFPEVIHISEIKVTGGYVWVFAQAIFVETNIGIGWRSLNADTYFCEQWGPTKLFAKNHQKITQAAYSFEFKLGYLFSRE